MRLPGKIKPGMVDTSSIVCAIDIMPTVLEACRLPAVNGIEGRSVYKVVTGKKQKTDRQYALTTFDYWSDSKEVHAPHLQYGLLQALGIEDELLHRKALRFHPPNTRGEITKL